MECKEGATAVRSSKPREGPLLGQAGPHQIPQEPRDMDTPVKPVCSSSTSED